MKRDDYYEEEFRPTRSAKKTRNKNRRHNQKKSLKDLQNLSTEEIEYEYDDVYTDNFEEEW